MMQESVTPEEADRPAARPVVEQVREEAVHQRRTAGDPDGGDGEQRQEFRKGLGEAGPDRPDPPRSRS